MTLRWLKWPAIILSALVVLLLFLAVLAYANRTRILVSLMSNEPFVEWAGTFERHDDYESEIPGSHAKAACQNSHANWGETTRQTVSLDGLWEIEEGSLTETAPHAFTHSIAVPGLLTEASPSFEEVGKRSKYRDAFWYRTQFTLSDTPSTQAYICLHKAVYGAKVWLNGVALGEHFGAYTLSEFDASEAIRYGSENELVVRLGADRSQLPEFLPLGDDDEIERWYPGLWDSVSLVMTGEVSIANIKIEPNIDTDQVTIKADVYNSGQTPKHVRLSQQIAPWLQSDAVVAADTIEVALDAGSHTTISMTLDIEAPQLWSPENPFLYLSSAALEYQNDNGEWRASDDRATRFGMRKVEWRSGKNKGFYLNNRLYYLRGTNIALHRFFGDAERGSLPWNENWVRRLLTGHPKDFHWNSFRFHNGRAPNFWYDIADETGFIIADEYNFWSVARGTESGKWSAAELEKEFRGWMRENWNHPSIGWWDAANENNNPLSTDIIRRVRELDSTRQWENGGYQAPAGPNDPIEEHPYKLNSGGTLNLNDRAYTLDDFSTMDGHPPQATWGLFATYADAPDHPFINNEYAFLWITQAGRPTPLAQSAFDTMTGGMELSPQEYREAYAYVTSELSAYWRAMRGYSGVQHFVYLSKCNDKDDLPENWQVQTTSATCDSFLDVEALELEPRWRAYARNVFAPQLIYLKEWRNAAYPRGETVAIPMVLLNDGYDPLTGIVRLYIVDGNGTVVQASSPASVSLEPLGKQEIEIALNIPDIDAFTVFAELSSPTEAFETVWSRRKVGHPHPGVALPDPPFSGR